MIRNVVARHIQKVASRPYLESMGLTKSKAMNDEAAMLYSIDQSSNKSKYYEMLILVNDDGTAQLIKRWGRLGARFQTKTEEYRDLDSAKRALLKTKSSKVRGSSKYRDAFDSRQHKTPDGKQLPKGQYPVGLSSNPGFWQNQDIQTCKPALRQLVTVIEEAVADAANVDMSGVLTDLELADGYVSELGNSPMAREIRKKIKAPLARLRGGGRHRADPDKTLRELKTLSRYLSKQLSMCMTASVVDRTASTNRTAVRFPLDGVRKHELMPRSLARKIPKLYEQDGVEDPIVYTKFFNPYGRGTWYITEFDGRETMFGYAKITSGELGYISLSELANANRNGLPLIERDLSWRPMPLSKAKGR